jgi:ornithine cyclodeaminase
MRRITVLTSSDVSRLLGMTECIAAMRAVFEAAAASRVVQPVRTVLRVPDGRGSLYVMPGWVDDGGGALAVKLVALFPANATRGIETHQGVIVLLDATTGEPRALIEASSVTAIRTAAVSALATDLLARADASELGILGAGVQAASHLEAMRVVRPIRHVRVWSRSPEHTAAFVHRASSHGTMSIEAVPTAEQAVRGAHVICTVTSASEPVLLGDWLSPGAHVNAVGASMPDARELDTRAVARARLFVDSREAAMAEAGDLLVPMGDGAIGPGHVAGDLAELVSGGCVGRSGDDDITLFKSLGLAIEDVAAARLLLERAATAGAQTVELD